MGHSLQSLSLEGLSLWSLTLESLSLWDLSLEGFNLWGFSLQSFSLFYYNDISLYDSLGIEFYEPLFLLVLVFTEY